MLKPSTAVALAIALGASPAFAEPSFEELAKEIVRLRGEIDDLNTRLEDQKEAHRTQLRALAQQKLTLETEVQRESQRRDQLNREVGRLDQRGKKDEVRVSSLRSAISAAIARMRPVPDYGVPFRRPERKATLETIANEMERGDATALQTLTKLWQFAESELNLTKSLSVESQVISVEGQEMLADVARAGTVLIYFRAPDGRVGAARPTADGWHWVVANAPEEIQQIGAFFLALEGRQRAGFFVLPGALAPVVESPVVAAGPEGK